MRAMRECLIRLVALVPLTVQGKLLAAFLTIVVLLIALGTVGLQVLSRVNHRTEELVKLQQKVAAYRQLQLDAADQLYSVASALSVPDEYRTYIVLQQLNQFGRDLDRVKSVAKDKVQMLSGVTEEQLMLP